MATYSQIIVPSVPGKGGVHVPESVESVRAALLLARCFVEDGGGRGPGAGAGSAIRHVGTGDFATKPRGYFGTFPETAAWASIEACLASAAVAAGGAPWDCWVIAGCTVEMEHFGNSDAHPQVSLSVTAPSGPVAATDALVSTFGDRVAPADEWPWWMYSFEGTALRFSCSEFVPDEYDELYDSLAALAPHRWVAAVVGRRRWTVLPLHASAPALAPPEGGFLEFVARVHALRASRLAIADAWGQFGVRGLGRWAAMRAAWMVGRGAIPEDLVDAPRALLVEYLHSPASLYGGLVEAEPRVDLARGLWWTRQRNLLKRRLSGGLHPGREVLDAFTVRNGWRRFRVRVMRESPVRGDKGDSAGEGIRWVEVTRGPRWLAGAAVR